MFSTPYNRPEPDFEFNNGDSLVEKIGYIPAQKRIENMILAGQRLKDFRAEQFDFPDGKEIDESFEDPTWSKNFDLADATRLDMISKQNLQNAQKRAEIAKKEADDLLKASQASPNPPGEV